MVRYFRYRSLYRTGFTEELLMAGLGGAGVLILAIVFFVPSTNLESGKPIYEPLTVAAFNAQNLGTRKFRKQDVMEIIIKIILRYDCICLQEVVTQDQGLLENLLKNVNTQSNRRYLMAASKRLGRNTSSKEQYLYLYKADRLKLLNDEVYPDTNKEFTRPPYIVHMESTTKDVNSFVAVCVHTKPDNAAREISALAEVFDYTKKAYKNENTILMGDLNAACGGVRVNDWANIALFTRPEFAWIVNDSVDTSSYTSGCANDRIVIAGNNMKSDFIRNSARAFDFQEAYSLTSEQTRAVSDHYPVEMALKGKVSQEIAQNVEASICVIVSDQRSTNPQILINKRNNIQGFDVAVYKDVNGNDVRVDATVENSDINEIFSLFDEMNGKLSGLISRETTETLKYKAKFGSLNDAGTHTDIASPRYSLTVDCFVQSSNCLVQMCKDTYYN